jgi:hypothetical protein
MITVEKKVEKADYFTVHHFTVFFTIHIFASYF